MLLIVNVFQHFLFLGRRDSNVRSTSLDSILSLFSSPYLGVAALNLHSLLSFPSRPLETKEHLSTPSEHMSIRTHLHPPRSIPLTICPVSTLTNRPLALRSLTLPHQSCIRTYLPTYLQPST